VFTQDFTTGGGGALPPGSTFSRGTIGTLYNSQGLVAYAPSNLYLYSQTFTNSGSWGTVAGTVAAAPSIVAPDGTNTAYSFVPNTVNTFHYFQQAIATTATNYTFSIYALAGAYQYGVVAVNTIGQVVVNLITGAITQTVGLVSATATAVGGGWYRITATATCAVGTQQVQFSGINQSTWLSFAADGVSGAYFWGAQAELGSTATTYTPTTTAAVYGPRFDSDPTNVLQQNLILNSSNPGGTYWSNQNLVFANNVLQAPDGTYTGTSVTAPTTGFTYLQTAVPTSVYYNSATTLTYSVFVKANTISQLYIGLYDTSFVGTSASAVVLSGPGTLVNVAGSEYSLTGLSTTQWTQVAVTRTGFAAQPQFYIYPNNNSSTPAGGSIGVWNPNVNLGSTALPYLATTSTPQTVCAPKGLLIEEARTNICYPSIPPATGYIYQFDCTTTANSGTAPDGTNTATLYTVTGINAISMMGLTSTASTTYTISAYLQAGTVNNVLIGMGNSASVNGFVANVTLTGAGSISGAATGTGTYISSTITALPNGWYRVTATGTVTDANDRFYFSNANSSLTTGTFYIWGAQVEAGGFPTSYIPTTTAAVTRNADSLTITNISGWYNQNASTMVFQADTSSTSATAFPGLGSFNAVTNSSANDVSMFTTTASGVGARVDVSGVAQQASTANTYTVGSTFKAAAYFNASNLGVVLNGGGVNISTNVSMPTGMTQMQIGNVYGNLLNGHIRSFSYYNYAMTNTQLQQVTT
jgi:hypothetical protein